MKPAILVTREVFDEVLASLGAHFEVEANQDGRPLSPDERVARRAQGLDMRVICYNTKRLPQEIERACNATCVGLDELLATSAMLNGHTPYPSAAHPPVGAGEFARMKPGVVYIHAARGGVLDDAALVAALSAATPPNLLIPDVGRG